MKIRRILCIAALLALPVAARAQTSPSDSVAAKAPTPSSDPRAVEVADKIMKALGGQKHWDELVGLRWSFGFEQSDTVRNIRRHSWNKQSGWHRVEGKNRAGQSFCYIENLNDGHGMAWVNGNAIEGDSLQKLLKVAKRLWTNDTYWMLMPYKLRDPGVMLGYDGEVKDSTGDYEKLALSFDHVGQTPGDRYWVFVNKKNHRIEKWDYLLEKQPPPAEHATWEAWQEHGGLWFPTAHRTPDGGNVFTRDVETVAEFKPTEFTAP